MCGAACVMQEGDGEEEVQRLEGLRWVLLALLHPASLLSEVGLQEMEEEELESGMD